MAAHDGAAFPVSGPFAPGYLPLLLPSIYLRRRTGMLRFQHAEQRCGLRFSKGSVVYGEASDPTLHMGEVMVGEGILTRENLDLATERVHRERRRLGEVLTAMGLVDQELLEEALALHVREILARLFLWREGTYGFEEQDEHVRLEHDFPLKMTTGSMILDAVRRVTDREAVLFGVGPLDRLLMPSTEPLLVFQRIALTPIDAFVLSRVDGTLTGREVQRVTPLPADVVAQSLLALMCTGMLEVTERPMPAEHSTAQFLRQEILDAYAGRRRPPHELLGVASDAKEAELKAAYLRLAKRYHPDVHHDPSLSDLRDKLEAIFSAVTQGYETLLRVRRTARPAVSPSATSPAATTPVPTAEAPKPEFIPVEDLLLRAEERLAESRHWEAVALFQEVLIAATGRVRRRARLGLARVYAHQPEAVKHAERELLQALQEDAADFEACYQLGCLYQREGLPARAIAMLRRVVELKPEYADARIRLDGLQPTSEAEEPPTAGLLGRMFGKPK
jgi:tetratricopeptide (TPR) repeat protein